VVSMKSLLSPAKQAHNDSLFDEKEYINRFYKHSMHWIITPAKQETLKEFADEIPNSIHLIGERNPDNKGNLQLYLDHQAVHKANFTIDTNEDSLSFKKINPSTKTHISGIIHFLEYGIRGYGNLIINNKIIPITADLAPVNYSVDVAMGTQGKVDIADVVGKSKAMSLRWFPHRPQWAEAKWIKNALTFSYGLKGERLVGQKEYLFHANFKDNQTQSSWGLAPDNPLKDSNFLAFIDSEFRFFFNVTDGETPNDDRSHLSPSETEGIKSLFPYLMNFQFDGTADAFVGAMLVGDDSPLGQVIAMSGKVNNPAVLGQYTLEQGEDSARFEIKNHQLFISNQLVSDVLMHGSSLHYQGLNEKQCQLSGLPSEGQIDFNHNGHYFTINGEIKGKRLGYREQNTPIFEAVNQNLHIVDLLNQSQFEKDQNNNYSDVIREKSMTDFYSILKYHMPTKWYNLFVSKTPATLDGALLNISQVRGKNNEDPKKWYNDLSIAYLTNGLSHVKADGSGQLNDKRAQAYLSDHVSKSAVFQAQSPLLYKNQWIIKFSEMGDFLSDQVENASKYESWIQQDVTSWKAQINQYAVSSDRKKELLNEVDTVSSAAIKNKTYWAYTTFRFVTTQTFLNYLQAVSIGGASSIEGSAIMRTVQQYSSIMSILDPGGTTIHAYLKVIQSFQIGNILPQLIDYSGNTDFFNIAVNEILKSFVKQYKNSPDKDLKNAAVAIEKAISSKQMSNMLHAYQNLATTFSSLYTYQKLVTVFEKESRAKGWDIVAAKGLSTAMCGAGLGYIIYFLGYQKGWDQLNSTQKSQFIYFATSVFTEVFAGVLKRGISAAAAFSSGEEGFLAGTKSILKGLTSAEEIAQAESRLSSGLAKWVVKDADYTNAALFGSSGSWEAGDTLATKIFGQSLDDFVATRLGAALSVANLVLSSIALSKANDPYDKAGDSLFVASASLELFAIAGGWAISSGTVAIGGMEIATLASAASGLAAAAAIAGIVILLVYAFTHKPKSPLQKFAEDTASSLGLYMKDGVAIDYFQVYQIKNQVQKVGLSFMYNGDSKHCLKMGPNQEVTSGPLDYNYDTCLFLKTNASGQSTIAAYIGTTEKIELYYLTNVDGKNVAFQKPLSGKDATKQRWICTYAGGVVKEEAHLESANFTISPVGSSEQLIINDLGSGKVTIGTPMGILGEQFSWKLQMQPIKNSAIRDQDINLYTYQRDQKTRPFVGQMGSAPNNWSITPELPSFLELDAKTGQISQKAGVPPSKMNTTAYTLKAKNPISEATAKVNLTVDVFTPEKAQEFAEMEPLKEENNIPVTFRKKAS